MRNLPVISVIDKQQLEKQALLEMIGLERRPRLDIGLSEIERIAQRLASNGAERVRFVTDPTFYLKENAIPVSNCKFSVQDMPSTSEACTVFAVCVAAVWTWVGAVQSVVAAFNAGAVFNAAVYFTVYTYTQVNSGGGGGCFLPGALVNVAHNSAKPIQNLSIGDKVLSFNQKTRKLEYNPVTRVYRTEQPRYYLINDLIKTTAPHPFRVNDKWAQAKDIKVGDVLVSKDNEPVKVESISVVNEACQVFNLTVDNAHTYFVHDVLVHNKTETGGGGMVWNLGTAGTLV